VKAVKEGTRKADADFRAAFDIQGGGRRAAASAAKSKRERGGKLGLRKS